MDPMQMIRERGDAATKLAICEICAVSERVMRRQGYAVGLMRV